MLLQTISGKTGDEDMTAPDLIVVKVGSSTLVDDGGKLDRGFIDALCIQIAELRTRGKRVIVVSSGAAAAGREVLGFASPPTDIPTLQACAATGQAKLIESYEKALAIHGLSCGQVLLTRRDVIDRMGYLNARNTVERLLDLGVVPIVNENDTVSVAEFTFGDNDMLGAIVSALVSADLYVILSDVAGLYTADPSLDDNARLISRVDHIDKELFRIAGSPFSSYGTGGMFSKVSAARMMMAAGIPTFICHGRMPNCLIACVDETARGTLFKQNGSIAHENPRKLWIGLAEVPQGTITLDAGAMQAVLSQGASILPVGVTACEGSFKAGDVVDVNSFDGLLIGRGTIAYDLSDLERFKGLKLDVIARFAGESGALPAIHRDDLFIF